MKTRLNVRWIFGALILTAVAVFLIFGRRTEPPLNANANETQTAPAATPSVSPASSPRPTPTPASEALPNASTESLLVPSTDEVPFETRLADLAQCLKLRDIRVGDEAEGLDFFSLNNSLAQKFGGLKGEADLWASTEIQTPGGVRRRLFADFRKNQPSLRYLEIQKDGSQKNLELSAEQSSEPSESLIASLESDGHILGRARERLVSYNYGQKIQLREVDGKVYSFKVTQGAKTFSCSRDPQQSLKCACTE